MTNKEDTPMNEHNALLKKSRMTRYFIDAVITLSDDIPVDAITLRQVAAAAGESADLPADTRLFRGLPRDSRTAQPRTLSAD